MSQTQIQGMRLRTAADSSRINKNWILQTGKSLLACTVLLYMLADLTGISSTEVLVPMWITGACLCVICGILTRYRRQQWFYLGLLPVVLLLVLFTRQKLLEGFRICWNQTSDTLTAQTGWVLPEWERQLPETQEKACLLLFAVLLAAMISWMVCLLADWAPRALALVLAGVLLAGMILFQYDASVSCLLPVLTTVMLLLLCSGWKEGNALPAVLLGGGILGVAVCIMMAVALLPGVKKQTQEWFAQADRAIHTYRYETENTTLPEGDFTEYQEPEEKPEDAPAEENEKKKEPPALVVTMSKPEAMHLRGFTGCTFANDVWKPQDTRELAQKKDFRYWMNLNAFYPHTQFAAAMQDDTRNATVSVQNVGACSKYMYVPFTLCNGSYLKPENLNTGGIPINGERSYIYTVVEDGAGSVPQVLENLQKAKEETAREYLQTESVYRDMIYDTYLEVPDDVKNLLKAQWDKVAAEYGGVDKLTLEQRQACALTFLGQCFPAGGTPENIKLPLDQARGTSYQYATVAAMTLRYYGIPARYVEGYVISEQMASGAAENEALELDSSCAQAWVEVYQDGAGWIPMEYLPGMGNAQDKKTDADSSGKTSNSNTPDEKEQEEPDTAEVESKEPDSSSGTVVKIKRQLLRVVFLVLILLFALCLLLVFRRNHVLKQRMKKYQNENRNEAISWIFADCVLLLEQLGFQRGNGSIRRMHDPVQEKFGEEYAKEFSDMTNLNDHAMFSRKPLTEQQRETAMAFRNTTVSRLRTETKWRKRLWMKWIQCLF